MRYKARSTTDREREFEQDAQRVCLTRSQKSLKSRLAATKQLLSD